MLSQYSTANKTTNWFPCKQHQNHCVSSRCSLLSRSLRSSGRKRNAGRLNTGRNGHENHHWPTCTTYGSRQATHTVQEQNDKIWNVCLAGCTVLLARGRGVRDGLGVAQPHLLVWVTPSGIWADTVHQYISIWQHIYTWSIYNAITFNKYNEMISIQLSASV